MQFYDRNNFRFEPSKTPVLDLIDKVKGIYPNAVLIKGSDTYNLAVKEFSLIQNTLERPKMPEWFRSDESSNVETEKTYEDILNNWSKDFTLDPL